MSLKKKWESQLESSYITLKEVENNFNFLIPSKLYKVEEEYPILIPKHYLDLIDRNNIPDDPIWKQCLPDIRELDESFSHSDQSNHQKFISQPYPKSAILTAKNADTISIFSEDSLAEESQMPVPRLIHRYNDRVVMLTTNRCSMQCRFCFRKRYWKNGTKRQDISNDELNKICDYLSDNQNIREVLVSGGDPLILKTARLKYILDQLSSKKTIDIIRIATRVPITLPSRIDKELTDMLAGYPGLWFATHFNHPKEITPESIKAVKLVINSGIPILNQTVLLKGINDKAEILEDLFRKLIKLKVKPHYLFHVDPVKGGTHFSTGIESGLNILRQFRPRLSSIAVPHFAIDLPDGGGKVSLQPDYTKDKSFLSIDEKRIIPYY